jgi:hypothetical protein
MAVDLMMSFWPSPSFPISLSLSMSRSHNPSPHFTFVIIVIVTKRVCSPSVPQSVFGVALQEENIPACV